MARPKKSPSNTAASRVERRRVSRARKVESEFKNIRSEGGVLPSEFLSKLAAGDVQGLRAEDYRLDPGERLNERVSAVWTRVKRFWDDFQAKRATLPKDDFGTTLTRKNWLIPLLKILDYGEPVPQRAGVVGHQHLLPDVAQAADQGKEVAHPVIDDRDHNTPFVEGIWSPKSGSMLTAVRSARARALNAPSMM